MEKPIPHNPIPDSGDPKDWSELIVGSSKFKDDTWDLAVLMQKTTRTINSNHVIHFYKILNPAIRFIAKQYAYTLLDRKPSTPFKAIASIKPFNDFLATIGIARYSEVTFEVFDRYNEKLKERYDDGKLAANTAYAYTHYVEQLMAQGQVYGFEVPGNLNFEKRASSAWMSLVVADKEENKNKPIDRDILNIILNCALNELGEHYVVKYTIIIQSQTGLRLNETLGLRVNCLDRLKDGQWVLEVFVPKSEGGNCEIVAHKIFVNDLVAQAVQELKVITSEMREKVSRATEKKIFEIKNDKSLTDIERRKLINKCKENDISNFLFLEYRRYPENFIQVPIITSFRRRLVSFVERNYIKDPNAKPTKENPNCLFYFNSHRFRSTFVKALIDENVPLSYISEHLAHLSLDITDHYVTLRDEDIKKQLGRVVLSPESYIVGKRAQEIKETTKRLFEGKTVIQIQDVIDNLVDSMSFNPLPTGVCLHDARRGNCSNGDGCFFYNCDNFLTELKFYPILKKELDMLRLAMDRAKSLNMQRDYERSAFVWSKLKPLVDSLEEESYGQKH